VTGIRAAWLVLFSAVALAVAPVAAEAATTRYVDGTNGMDVGNCDTPATACKTITYARGPAEDGDTVQIAAGVYPEAVATDERLNFVGAGAGTLESDAGATVIEAPAFMEALLMEGGGSARDLKARGGEQTSGIRIVGSLIGPFSYALTDVIGTGGGNLDPSGGSGDGLRATADDPTKPVSLSVVGGQFRGGISGSPDSGKGGAGGSFTGAGLNANVSGSYLDGNGSGNGLRASNGARATFLGVDATGGAGGFLADATVEIARSRVRGHATGVFVNDIFPATPTAVTLSNSIVTSTAALASFTSYAVSVTTSNGNDSVGLTFRGSTIYAGGLDPEGGIRVEQGATAPGATAELRNSIVRMRDSVEPDEGELTADRGSITAFSSSFSSTLELNGGTATAAGSGTNVSGDPLLSNPDGGDFSLQSMSALVDRGDPAVAAAGELDFAGNPRSLDGNADCQAAPDIGALERPDMCPPPPPLLNLPPALTDVTMTNRVFAPVRLRATDAGRRVKRGTRFVYTVSEPAEVRIVIERSLPGRRSGKRCVKPTARNRGARRCRRYRKVTTLRTPAPAGRRATRFSGRVRRRALARGRYRARLVAIDPAGGRSPERRLRFRIVRRTPR
jgi:hypothetical protein